jgi:excisionase family DNA binding protein
MSTNGPLTTGQAAEYCHVSQATIVNWIKDRQLTAYTTPGGHRRIPRGELVSFLQAHGMPVDPALKRTNGRPLLLIGDSPRIEKLAQILTKRNGFEICMARSDYEAGAKITRSEPDTVIIDMESSSDPLGLCRWIGESAEDICLIVIGNEDEERPALAAGANAYVAVEGPAGLRERITALLE